ncbi:cytochrome P450 [Nonomuraea phyllanthi]|uniref:cytochrome P450 n=1 Tax=Nonomuraea phyllanthi TaxID=2219224 RepID=UPI001292E265|nr:cytochrome P450 [Nonomuraea phyllanthi]QFY13423.1 cytochrome P450 [Nonomuraea phyllanthi]
MTTHGETTTEPLPGLPTDRPNPFDPPAALRPIRDRGPLHRMTYADGRPGWLVTGYAEARTVLDDPRFSNSFHADFSPPIEELAVAKAPETVLPPGFFLAMDDPEHARFRKLLIGQFTTRRMQALEPHIIEIVEARLDEMARTGSPADLVTAFARPIPSMVICELLGVPYADRDRFQEDADTMVDLERTAGERAGAVQSVMGYLAELVGRKRAEPADDMLGGLVAGGALNDAELAGVATFLLVAGHDTTANMLGLGTFLLLQNPDQAALLRQDPALADQAVEEMLRYLTIAHIGPIRVATEDVPMSGQTIRAGETVTISLPVAHRDPDRFADPDRLDLTRHSRGHLAFGHGIHQCLGQQLARVELRVAYPALLRRFPGLRLTVPPEQVPLRTRGTLYGVDRLPVAW